MAEENREVFLEAGGKEYRYIPCLNDGDEQMALMLDLVRRNLHGWRPPVANDLSRGLAAYQQMVETASA